MTSTAAKRLKLLRKNLGLTQEQLSLAVDIDRSYLSRVERGKAGLNLDQLARIASTYKVNLNWLVVGEGTMLSEPVSLTKEEIEGFTDALEQLPELKEILVMIQNDPKSVGILRRYHSFALKHREVAEKMGMLTERQFEDKIELFLRLIAT